MGIELLRKYVISCMRVFYRSVVRHPFLVGVVFLLISMHQLFPVLFSLLVYASPVIVSTAVLLGTLLSFGQPNIPEVEKEEKSDCVEIRKSVTKVMSHAEIVGRDGSFAAEETNGSRTEVVDESFEERTLINDDNSSVDVSRLVGLVDDGVFMADEKSKQSEEHLIDEAKNEVVNSGVDLDEEKVVLGSHYSQLQQSEDENTVLESDDKLKEVLVDLLHSDSVLLWERVEADNNEDDEGSDSGSDLAESSSPDASMADIIPMLDELHPLLAEEQEAPQATHMPHDGTDAASEHSLESSDSSSESNDVHDIANQEDLEVGDDEDKDSKHTDKEDETRSPITWTEDDQKNLMNLGTSELERNQRLENLIARRRARKAMRLQAEKNLIDLESADLPWNVPPISTLRNNPFDISYDSHDNIPGSAPSVLLPRRNPFDLPYDSSEEKPDLVGDPFEQEFAAFQPKEPFFRRHESFNVGPSIFGPSRQERQETKLKPYFVPEQVASDVASFSSFQRQLSELSDSKVSSVPDTESISSAGDLENKDITEDDLSHEAELISEKEHVREHPDLISKADHAPEASKHVSEHVSQGSQSSEDGGNVESIQVVKGDDRHDEQETSVGNLTDQENEESDLPEIENAASSMELMSQAIHLNLGDQELHSNASSLSSSDEVSEQIYNEKEGDEMPTSASETEFYFVDRGNSIERSGIDITDLVVEESRRKEPIYDSSPRAVAKNLSSSSISTDLHADISESGQSPPTLERTSSFPGRGSQETMQKIETDCPGNNVMSIDSSQRDAEEDIGSRSIIDQNLNESELNLGLSEGEEHLHNDKSFQQTEDQLHSTNAVTDVKVDSTAADQLSIVPDNEEPLLPADNISTSLPNKPLPEAEESLLDMEASIKLERDQVLSSSCQARSHEDNHEEEVISQPEKESSLLDRSMDKPSGEDPAELQVHISSVTSLNINSALSAGPDVVEIAGIETEAPKDPAYASDIHRIENSNVPDNTDNVDEIKEIHDTLLVELDAVGDFSVKDLGSTLNEMEQDPPALEHVLETNRSGDEDSYAKDLGSTLNEMKQDPHASEHDLETNQSGDEDSYSKDLGSTSNEIKQDPHALEHDLETNCSGGEDFYANDLGSNLNAMKQDPHALEHDPETNRSADDSYSTVVFETKTEMDAEDLMKSQNEKEMSKNEVVCTSEAEASTTKSIDDAREVSLPQKTESSTPGSISGRTMVNQVKANGSSVSDSDKE